MAHRRRILASLTIGAIISVVPMLVPDEALSDTMKMTVGMPGMIAVMLGFIVLDPPGPLSLVHSAILHTMYFGATALVWAGILFLCLPGAPSRHGRA